MISDAKIAAVVRSLVERGDDRMALVETVQTWEVIRLLAEGNLDGAIRYATLFGIDHVVAILKADGQPGMRGLRLQHRQLASGVHICSEQRPPRLSPVVGGPRRHG